MDKDKPKRDILGVIFCDLIGEECINPELSCYKCNILKESETIAKSKNRRLGRSRRRY